MKTVRLFHYGNPRALFCSRACREAFKEDRKAGLIYGPYYLTDFQRPARDAEEMSMLTKTCPYCGAQEGDPI